MKKKRKFTSFSLDEALSFLGIEKLLEWKLESRLLPPSDFFHERMRRLDGFAVGRRESGKELLIDAVCEEVVDRHRNLRIWKQEPVQSEQLLGITDYLIARRIDFLSKPLLCVIEAKKDDFERGTAQCLLTMEVCRENNVKSGFSGKVLGIVSNGEGWKFYRLDEEGKVWESLLFSIAQIEILLGAVDSVFNECDELVALAKSV